MVLSYIRMSVGIGEEVDASLLPPGARRVIFPV
jgi:hypothetical protein